MAAGNNGEKTPDNKRGKTGIKVTRVKPGKKSTNKKRSVKKATKSKMLVTARADRIKK